MKDDIKEKMTIGKAKKILRGFLAKDCYYDTPLYYAIPYLLDYITNLQQENEKLKKDYYEEYDIHLKDKTYYFNLFEDYKSRCEKAVEELELWQPKIESLKLEKEYLLNILNGRSDE